MGKKKPRRQKHVPQRTCVACLQKKDKRLLTRIVRTSDQGVVVDPTGKRNGRGAYLCDQYICWEKVLNNIRLLNKVLMVEVSQEEIALIAAHKPLSNEDILN